MSVFVNLESVMCVCTSGLLSLLAPEEEGAWLPVSMFGVSPASRCC